MQQLLQPYLPDHVLDLGAGRGISSYAFAQSGSTVMALEPDSSQIVGAGAIRALVEQTQLPIQAIQEYGETLPFSNQIFDVVYGRAVLHHARDLKQLCQEAARVLKPGGAFLATREHVISHKADLPRFLEAHSLHRYYGGENVNADKKSDRLGREDVLSSVKNVVLSYPRRLRILIGFQKLSGSSGLTMRG